MRVAAYLTLCDGHNPAHSRPFGGSQLQEEHRSMETDQMNRRELLKRGALGGIGLAGIGTALNANKLGSAFAHSSDAAVAGYDPMLVAAAQKEGHLNVITLPRGW